MLQKRVVKTALVTGGAGFLGSHLCDRLISEGKQVICIDNLLSGRLGNINHLIGREMVLEMTGSRAPLAFTAANQDDPRQRRPAIGQAEALLDWSPQIPLSEGLARTVAHFADALETAPFKKAAALS